MCSSLVVIRGVEVLLSITGVRDLVRILYYIIVK